MTAPSRFAEAWCADGQPELVTIHLLAGQRLPLRVTTARPLAVVACEALTLADRLLAQGGARLALKAPAAELQGDTSTVE